MPGHGGRGGCPIIGAEFLDAQGTARLKESLARQPDWSDFPLIILVEAGGVETGWRVLRELECVGNVALLERTAVAPAVVGAMQAALRSRRRQYAVGDRLCEQEQQQSALRETEEHSQEMLDSAKDYAIFSLDTQGASRVGMRARKKFSDIPGRRSWVWMERSCSRRRTGPQACRNKR